MVLSDSARVDFQQDFSHLPYRPFYPSHLGESLSCNNNATTSRWPMYSLCALVHYV